MPLAVLIRVHPQPKSNLDGMIPSEEDQALQEAMAIQVDPSKETAL